MEFLLINHPLDCPICDQGGECELQDVSMGYGEDVSRFSERKRVVKDEDLGPLIATEMTRCIHCTRCVRFGAEIAGLRELGATGRGEDMRIGTFVEHTVSHELSGNIIDLCPVGALTSKPYRFTARAWELTSDEGIAPHDGVGSNLQLHIRGEQVMRVHPRDNEAVNECWISDRDRFSYEGLSSPERLTAPMIKRDGAWQEVEWQEALSTVVGGLRGLIDGLGADHLGCLIAPNATLEEQYLFQKLVRTLGCDNIDSRVRQQDFRGDSSDPLLPWLGLPIAELERQTAVLLIGSDIRHEQPLLAHRLRKAALDGAEIAVVNAYELELMHPARQLTAVPGCLLLELAAIAKALGVSPSGSIKPLLDQAEVGEVHQTVADSLRQAGTKGSGLVLLGALAEADPDFTLLKALAWEIAAAAECRVGLLAQAANSTGAYVAGALPHRLPGAKAIERPGLNALSMLHEPRQGYLLWGLEPDLDLTEPGTAIQALDQAGFVVACASFRSSALDQVADILLPLAAFAETAGTFVNTAGDWQRFQGAVPPVGDARPGWKVLRVLGNLLELNGFEQNTAKQVHDELAAQCDGLTPDNRLQGTPAAVSEMLGTPLVRVGNVPIYATDALVRHAPALQRTQLVESLAVSLHPKQAAELGLAAGDEVAIHQNGHRGRAQIVLDDRCAIGTVRIPAAVGGSESLGAQIGTVALEKL
jgi:NADH-quinone oxidoreductase subunit G